MSNSGMVVYTKLSPNNSGTRTKKIDRITPHCVVGQLSVEGIGAVFATKSRKASSNYGIGKDGRVGMYVEESKRSWCSSSAANDQRAVTIECASDTKDPYKMNAAVINTLVNLCADICRRNGKNKITWIPNKEKALSYNQASDEMLITVHRWFANKSCPGDYLYNRLQEIAEKVNNILSGSTATGSAKGVNEVKATTAADNEKTIWNFLISKGFTAYAAAGIMGNLYAESGLRPENLQNTYEKKLSLSDTEYTAAVDNGSYTNFVKDSAGYGLAQWTYYTRKQSLYDYVKAAGASIGDLSAQLNFLYKELSENYKSVVASLNKATSVKAASDIILTKYERPANQGDAVKTRRAGYGQIYYNKYAGSAKTESAAAAKSNLPTYKTGKEYTLQANLYVRKTAAGEKKDYSDLTKDGRKHGYKDGVGKAILRKGTVVTCKGTQKNGSSMWIKIPSGYICGYTENGTVYVK